VNVPVWVKSLPFCSFFMRLSTSVPLPDLAQQGDAFVMPQDPASYTFGNLPSAMSAVEIGVSTFPYRAVIGIHSLQRNTRCGLIIDGVDVLLDTATPVTGPVNVFLAGASLSYNSEGVSQPGKWGRMPLQRG
jgi:hypothetical protein